jgi:hypothetical protein
LLHFSAMLSSPHLSGQMGRVNHVPQQMAPNPRPKAIFNVSRE